MRAKLSAKCGSRWPSMKASSCCSSEVEASHTDHARAAESRVASSGEVRRRLYAEIRSPRSTSGIAEAAHLRAAAGTRAAMQQDDRLALRVAALFVVQAVARIDLQRSAVEGLDLGVKLAHRRSPWPEPILAVLLATLLAVCSGVMSKPMPRLTLVGAGNDHPPAGIVSSGESFANGAAVPRMLSLDAHGR